MPLRQSNAAATAGSILVTPIAVRVVHVHCNEVTRCGTTCDLRMQALCCHLLACLLSLALRRVSVRARVRFELMQR